jgi:hypothetical protein
VCFVRFCTFVLAFWFYRSCSTVCGFWRSRPTCRISSVPPRIASLVPIRTLGIDSGHFAAFFRFRGTQKTSEKKIVDNLNRAKFTRSFSPCPAESSDFLSPKLLVKWLTPSWPQDSCHRRGQECFLEMSRITTYSLWRSGSPTPSAHAPRFRWKTWKTSPASRGRTKYRQQYVISWRNFRGTQKPCKFLLVSPKFFGKAYTMHTRRPQNELPRACLHTHNTSTRLPLFVLSLHSQKHNKTNFDPQREFCGNSLHELYDVGHFSFAIPNILQVVVRILQRKRALQKAWVCMHTLQDINITSASDCEDTARKLFPCRVLHIHTLRGRRSARLEDAQRNVKTARTNAHT